MRAILICPQESLRTKFEAIIAEYSGINVVKTLVEYPAPDTLRRLIRSTTPDLLLLSMENTEAAETMNAMLGTDFARIPRIGLASNPGPAVFRQAMRLGIRELLASPFQRADVGEALGQIKTFLEEHPATIGSTDHFLAFMPAKAGVGASTVAANFTWALGEMPGCTPILADFDQHSGVVGFLFNANNEFTLADPNVRAKLLDEDSWGRLITRAGKVDLLLSGAPHPGEAIHHSQVSDIAEFLRRNYSVVSADLPDTFDETSIGVLHDARRIFLVTTPELPALRLAKLKMQLLRKFDLEGKVSLVVNRVTPRMELTLDEIEKSVGINVYATFPSDYADVTKSLRSGAPSQKLVNSARAFAEKILNQKLEPKKRARFIERFAVSPLKYGFQ